MKEGAHMKKKVFGFAALAVTFLVVQLIMRKKERALTCPSQSSLVVWLMQL